MAGVAQLATSSRNYIGTRVIYCVYSCIFDMVDISSPPSVMLPFEPHASYDYIEYMFFSGRDRLRRVSYRTQSEKLATHTLPSIPASYADEGRTRSLHASLNEY